MDVLVLLVRVMEWCCLLARKRLVMLVQGNGGSQLLLLLLWWLLLLLLADGCWPQVAVGDGCCGSRCSRRGSRRAEGGDVVRQKR